MVRFGGIGHYRSVPSIPNGVMVYLLDFILLRALISRYSEAVAFSGLSICQHDHVGHVFILENPQHDVVFLSSESVSVSVVDQNNKYFLSFVMILTFLI